MKMKSRLCLLGAIVLLFSSNVASGSDCTGRWSTIDRYNSANGSPCVQLGLDSHIGICLPGQPFIILCDDTSKGRYRLCLGRKRCVGPQPVPEHVNAKHQVCVWDFITNNPCPPGFLNLDCRDSCETALPLAP